MRRVSGATAPPVPAAPAAVTPADRGSAVVEFIGGSVVLLMPLVYLLLTVFTVQRAMFAADEAAREAGRALSLAGTTAGGWQQASYAAGLAFTDQGLPPTAALRVVAANAPCSAPPVTPVLTPGARYAVCVSERVALPFTSDRVLGRFAAAAVTVVGRYVLVIGPFQALP